MAQLEVRRHNETQLSLMKEGDLIEFDRGIFSHWGVYIGKETVVHVTSSDDSGVRGVSNSSNCCNGGETEKIVVKIDNFWKIAKKSKAFRNNEKDSKMTPLSRREIVENALSKIGKYGYSLLFENCEHFASWCRYGERKSDQADNALTGLAVFGAAALTVALIGGGVAYVRSNSSKKKEKTEENSYFDY